MNFDKINMKLIDLLPYLYFLDKVRILQYDAYIDKTHEPEEIFFGSVLDVPWWIAEMYLHKMVDGEPIMIGKDKEEPYFDIAVVEVPYEEK